MSEINSTTFEYGGYHFTPVRQFKKGEIDKPLAGDSRPWKSDVHYAMRNMRTGAIELFNYSYDSFYTASTDTACDIFRCEETGRLYVPGQNELFGYNEPQQKSTVKNSLSQAKGTALQNRADKTIKRGNSSRNRGDR